MQRIVHITSVHQPFDTRIFYKECRSLLRPDREVILIAPARFERTRQDGVKIIGLPPYRARWGRPLNWLRLLTHCVRLRPDVIHLHDPELLAIVPLLRVYFKSKTRIVYDVHEYFISSIAHKPWLPSSLRSLSARLAQLAERTLGKGVDGLIFVVEEQSPLYADWQANKIVIHNYPDLDAFQTPRPLAQYPPDRFRLIYFGSLYARRGVMTMLRAMNILVETIPEVLLILGGKFEDRRFEQQVNAFIQDNHLSGNIALLGWIDHREIKHYYASADVAWEPRIHIKQNNGISTKMLEAMLMGLPIVTSDLPYHREIIEQAGSGLTVIPDDPSDHARALKWLHDHPQERVEMGSRGRKLILEKYNWQKEARRLNNFYHRISSDITARYFTTRHWSE